MMTNIRVVVSGLALLGAVLGAVAPVAATTRINTPAANTWSSVRTDTTLFTSRFVSGKVMRSTQNPHNVLLEPTANNGRFRTRVSITCLNGTSTSGWVTATFPAAGVVFTYCPSFQNSSLSGWGEIDSLPTD